MSDLNILVLSGRATVDPELRFTPSGTAVLKLRIASSRYYKDKKSETEGWTQKSVFLYVDLFGKAAERLAKNIHKGDPILAKGRLEFEEWQGADGRDRQTYRMIADELSLIGDKGRKSKADAEEPSVAEAA